MKKIQIITSVPLQLQNYNSYCDVNNFNNLNSLDNYEINVLDLTNSTVWRSKGHSFPSSSIVFYNDFLSIKTMISNSKKSKIVVCLPQNIRYECIGFTGVYELKDHIDVFIEVIKTIIPIDNLRMYYENNKTDILGNLRPSSFGFYKDFGEALTYSDISEKITSIVNKNYILTTNSIIDNDDTGILINYLNKIQLIDEVEPVPEWVHKYKFYDDDIQHEIIEGAKEKIKDEKDKIEKAQEKISLNLRYKSILYTNDYDLVSVVFKILEDIFEISLSEFVDEKKQDFLFKKDATTYIGEIKGVTSNIKYEHLSQLNVHYARYLDLLQENEQSNKIKKILIMNYERSRDVKDRNEIHDMQIKMAIKDEILIVDTQTLLNAYEMILNGVVTRDEFVKYVNSVNGKIVLKDIKQEVI